MTFVSAYPFINYLNINQVIVQRDNEDWTNPEKGAPLGIQDIGRRQSNQKYTTQLSNLKRV
jgi:hypothetical protein